MRRVPIDLIAYIVYALGSLCFLAGSIIVIVLKLRGSP